MTEKAWYTKLSKLNKVAGSVEIADWFKESDTKYNVMSFKDIPKEDRQTIKRALRDIQSYNQQQKNKASF